MDEFHDLVVTMMPNFLKKMTGDRLLIPYPDVVHTGDQNRMMMFIHIFSGNTTASTGVGTAQGVAGQMKMFRVCIEHLFSSASSTLPSDAVISCTTMMYTGCNTFSVNVEAIQSEQTTVFTVHNYSLTNRTLPLIFHLQNTAQFIFADKRNEFVSTMPGNDFDNRCTAQTAELFGQEENEKLFIKHLQHYKSLFNTEPGSMHKKDNHGLWRTFFTPCFFLYRQHEYADENAWQYIFFIPRDRKSLITSTRKRNAFCTKCDSLFEQNTTLKESSAITDNTGLINLHTCCNKTDHHITSLFSYESRPWKTRQMIRCIINEMYHESENSTFSNDDRAQMSALNVFDATDLSAVEPCEDRYDIGSSILDHATIAFANSVSFTVISDNNGLKNIYRLSAAFEGVAPDHPGISHEDITGDGTLSFMIGVRAIATMK